MRKKLITFLLVILLSFCLFYSRNLGNEQDYDFIKESNNILFKENFSKNPELNWIFSNAAYWNSQEENSILTEPGSELVGVIWLKNEIYSPFTAEFRYKAGGGSGADGFVFMFYKDWDYKPGIGGFLGFHCREVDEPCPRTDAPGYGLEFDNYFNSKAEYGDIYGEGDPSPNHIAIIKDFIGNHLIHVNDSRTEDNIWHNVRITVNQTRIRAWIDGEQLLEFKGTIDQTFGHIGFGSGIWGYDHQHSIDDFILYGNTITIKGLKSGWKVELISENNLVDEGEAKNSSEEVILDITGVESPIQGQFRIIQNGVSIYESKLLNNIWGGDIWKLASINIENSTTYINEDNLDPEIITVVIGVVAFISLLFYLSIRNRTKKL